MKLFCLTYAGGNAAFYDDLEKLLSDCIELIKFEYAGHGKRHKEKGYLTMEELARDAYICLKQNIQDNDEYALMGYSMGSIGTVELLKLILCDSEMRKPKRVFLAAHEPHTKSELAGFNDEENEELVKERTLKFGAVPEKLINNRTFWRTYLPIYKADYSIIRKYKFEKLDLKIDVPATVFYSETDTPIHEMGKWQQYFVNDCEFIRFDGNHFFIKDHLKDIAGVIIDKLGNK